MARPRIAIIGPGVVGSALGRLLRHRRFPVVAVAGRSHARARGAAEFIGGCRVARSPRSAARAAEVVFITTPDRAIRPVCQEIAVPRGLRRGSVVFHCSGSHSADLLAPVRERGAHAGALHPLQSFASAQEALRRMKGTWFTFDGDDRAADVAEALVSALGGRMIRVPPETRALYHAASCVLSNYLVSLADLGLIMLGLSGLGEKAAAAAQPLLRGTVENIGRLGMPAALTGPIARVDVETVQRHLRALDPLPREIRRLYCELGLYTVGLAQRKETLRPPEARRLVRLLRGALGRAE